MKSVELGALGEVHTHAQRLVLTSVVAEQSEFERRIGGAMCLMLQHRDHHVPAGGHFVPLIICSTSANRAWHCDNDKTISTRPRDWVAVRLGAPLI